MQGVSRRTGKVPALGELHFKERDKILVDGYRVDKHGFTGFLTIPFVIARLTIDPDNVGACPGYTRHPRLFQQVVLDGIEMLRHVIAHEKAKDVGFVVAQFFRLDVMQLVADDKGAGNQDDRYRKLHHHQYFPEHGLAEARRNFALSVP